MTRIAKMAVALAIVAVAFGAGWLANDLRAPHCPTEDSCEADYHDGRWHIREIVA